MAVLLLRIADKTTRLLLQEQSLLTNLLFKKGVKMYVKFHSHTTPINIKGCTPLNK